MNKTSIVFDFTIKCELGNGSTYIKHKFDGWYKYDDESESFRKASPTTNNMIEAYLDMETCEYRKVNVSEVREVFVDGVLMRVIPVEEVYPDHTDDIMPEYGIVDNNICDEKEEEIESDSSYKGEPDCPQCVRDGEPCEWHDPDWN